MNNNAEGLLGPFREAFCGDKACGVQPRKMPRETPHKKK
jgi:hypothetical protein